MQEKYGFIYIWYDCKYKRYYIGRHWGSIDDGYICSSMKMRSARARRPKDFKRRVVKIVHDKQLLVEEEQRWLNMIKPDEVGVRYYNISLKADTPTMRGHKHSEETRRKIGESNRGKVITEETKQKLREANKKQFADNAQRESRRQKGLLYWADSEYRSRMIDAHKGKKQSRETIEKRMNNMRDNNKFHTAPRSEKHKKRISTTLKEKYANGELIHWTKIKIAK